MTGTEGEPARQTPPRAEPAPGFAAIEYIPTDYFSPLDLSAIFSTPFRAEVDLGCGDGSFLTAMASRNPERNYLGTERLYGRIRTTSRKAQRAGLQNVRLLRVESAYLVTHLLPAASISRFYLLFPDPWPKRRHWPRRIVQPQFLAAAANALEPGGDFCIKTDDADYFRYIEKVAAGCNLLTRVAWEEEVPATDFERHYVAQGRVIQSLRLVKD